MEPGQLDIETYKQIKEIQDNPDMGMYYEAHLDLLDQNLEFTAENLDKMVQKRALGKITDPGARDKYINALQSIYSDNLVIVKDPTVTDDDNMTYLGLVTYEHKVTEFIGEDKEKKIGKLELQKEKKRQKMSDREAKFWSDIYSYNMRQAEEDADKELLDNPTQNRNDLVAKYYADRNAYAILFINDYLKNPAAFEDSLAQMLKDPIVEYNLQYLTLNRSQEDIAADKELNERYKKWEEGEIKKGNILTFSPPLQDVVSTTENTQFANILLRQQKIAQDLFNQEVDRRMQLTRNVDMSRERIVMDVRMEMYQMSQKEQDNSLMYQSFLYNDASIENLMNSDKEFSQVLDAVPKAQRDRAKEVLIENALEAESLGKIKDQMATDLQDVFFFIGNYTTLADENNKREFKQNVDYIVQTIPDTSDVKDPKRLEAQKKAAEVFEKYQIKDSESFTAFIKQFNTIQKQILIKETVYLATALDPTIFGEVKKEGFIAKASRKITADYTVFKTKYVVSESLLGHALQTHNERDIFEELDVDNKDKTINLVFRLQEGKYVKTYKPFETKEMSQELLRETKEQVYGYQNLKPWLPDFIAKFGEVDKDADLIQAEDSVASLKIQISRVEEFIKVSEKEGNEERLKNLNFYLNRLKKKLIAETATTERIEKDQSGLGGVLFKTVDEFLLDIPSGIAAQANIGVVDTFGATENRLKGYAFEVLADVQKWQKIQRRPGEFRSLPRIEGIPDYAGFEKDGVTFEGIDPNAELNINSPEIQQLTMLYIKNQSEKKPLFGNDIEDQIIFAYVKNYPDVPFSELLTFVNESKLGADEIQNVHKTAMAQYKPFADKVLEELPVRYIWDDDLGKSRFSEGIKDMSPEFLDIKYEDIPGSGDMNDKGFKEMFPGKEGDTIRDILEREDFSYADLVRLAKKTVAAHEKQEFTSNMTLMVDYLGMDAKVDKYGTVTKKLTPTAKLFMQTSTLAPQAIAEIPLSPIGERFTLLPFSIVSGLTEWYNTGSFSESTFYWTSMADYYGGGKKQRDEYRRLEHRKRKGAGIRLIEGELVYPEQWFFEAELQKQLIEYIETRAKADNLVQITFADLEDYTKDFLFDESQGAKNETLRLAQKNDFELIKQYYATGIFGDASQTFGPGYAMTITGQMDDIPFQMGTPHYLDIYLQENSPDYVALMPKDSDFMDRVVVAQSTQPYEFDEGYAFISEGMGFTNREGPVYQTFYSTGLTLSNTLPFEEALTGGAGMVVTAGTKGFKAYRRGLGVNTAVRTGLGELYTPKIIQYGLGLPFDPLKATGTALDFAYFKTFEAKKVAKQTSETIEIEDGLTATVSNEKTGTFSAGVLYDQEIVDEVVRDIDQRGQINITPGKAAGAVLGSGFSAGTGLLIGGGAPGAGLFFTFANQSIRDVLNVALFKAAGLTLGLGKESNILKEAIIFPAYRKKQGSVRNLAIKNSYNESMNGLRKGNVNPYTKVFNDAEKKKSADGSMAYYVSDLTTDVFERLGMEPSAVRLHFEDLAVKNGEVNLSTTMRVVQNTDRLLREAEEAKVGFIAEAKELEAQKAERQVTDDELDNMSLSELKKYAKENELKLPNEIGRVELLKNFAKSERGQGVSSDLLTGLDLQVVTSAGYKQYQKKMNLLLVNGEITKETFDAQNVLHRGIALFSSDPAKYYSSLLSDFNSQQKPHQNLEKGKEFSSLKMYKELKDNSPYSIDAYYKATGLYDYILNSDQDVFTKADVELYLSKFEDSTVVENKKASLADFEAQEPQILAESQQKKLDAIQRKVENNEKLSAEEKLRLEASRIKTKLQKDQSEFKTTQSKALAVYEKKLKDANKSIKTFEKKLQKIKDDASLSDKEKANRITAVETILKEKRENKKEAEEDIARVQKGTALQVSLSGEVTEVPMTPTLTAKEQSILDRLERLEKEPQRRAELLGQYSKQFPEQARRGRVELESLDTAQPTKSVVGALQQKTILQKKGVKRVFSGVGVDEVLNKINEERISKGLSPVKNQKELEQKRIEESQYYLKTLPTTHQLIDVDLDDNLEIYLYTVQKIKPRKTKPKKIVGNSFESIVVTNANKERLVKGLPIAKNSNELRRFRISEAKEYVKSLPVKNEIIDTEFDENTNLVYLTREGPESKVVDLPSPKEQIKKSISDPSRTIQIIQNLQSTRLPSPKEGKDVFNLPSSEMMKYDSVVVSIRKTNQECIVYYKTKKDTITIGEIHFSDNYNLDVQEDLDLRLEVSKRFIYENIKEGYKKFEWDANNVFYQLQDVETATKDTYRQNISEYFSTFEETQTKIQSKYEDILASNSATVNRFIVNEIKKRHNIKIERKVFPKESLSEIDTTQLFEFRKAQLGRKQVESLIDQAIDKIKTNKENVRKVNTYSSNNVRELIDQIESVDNIETIFNKVFKENGLLYPVKNRDKIIQKNINRLQDKLDTEAELLSIKEDFVSDFEEAKELRLKRLDYFIQKSEQKIQKIIYTSQKNDIDISDRYDKYKTDDVPEIEEPVKLGDDSQILAGSTVTEYIAQNSADNNSLIVFNTQQFNIPGIKELVKVNTIKSASNSGPNNNIVELSKNYTLFRLVKNAKNKNKIKAKIQALHNDLAVSLAKEKDLENVQHSLRKTLRDLILSDKEELGDVFSHPTQNVVIGSLIRQELNTANVKYNVYKYTDEAGIEYDAIQIDPKDKSNISKLGFKKVSDEVRVELFDGYSNKELNDLKPSLPKQLRDEIGDRPEADSKLKMATNEYDFLLQNADTLLRLLTEDQYEQLLSTLPTELINNRRQLTNAGKLALVNEYFAIQSFPSKVSTSQQELYRPFRERLKQFGLAASKAANKEGSLSETNKFFMTHYNVQNSLREIAAIENAPDIDENLNNAAEILKGPIARGLEGILKRSEDPDTNFKKLFFRASRFNAARSAAESEFIMPETKAVAKLKERAKRRLSNDELVEDLRPSQYPNIFDASKLLPEKKRAVRDKAKVMMSREKNIELDSITDEMAMDYIRELGARGEQVNITPADIDQAFRAQYFEGKNVDRQDLAMRVLAYSQARANLDNMVGKVVRLTDRTIVPVDDADMHIRSASRAVSKIFNGESIVEIAQSFAELPDEMKKAKEMSDLGGKTQPFRIITNSEIKLNLKTFLKRVENSPGYVALNESLRQRIEKTRIYDESDGLEIRFDEVAEIKDAIIDTSVPIFSRRNNSVETAERSAAIHFAYTLLDLFRDYAKELKETPVVGKFVPVGGEGTIKFVKDLKKGIDDVINVVLENETPSMLAERIPGAGITSELRGRSQQATILEADKIRVFIEDFRRELRGFSKNLKFVIDDMQNLVTEKRKAEAKALLGDSGVIIESAIYDQLSPTILFLVQELRNTMNPPVKPYLVTTVQELANVITGHTRKSVLDLPTTEHRNDNLMKNLLNDYVEVLSDYPEVNETTLKRHQENFLKYISGDIDADKAKAEKAKDWFNQTYAEKVSTKTSFDINFVNNNKVKANIERVFEAADTPKYITDAIANLYDLLEDYGPDKKHFTPFDSNDKEFVDNIRRNLSIIADAIIAKKYQIEETGNQILQVLGGAKKNISNVETKAYTAFYTGQISHYDRKFPNKSEAYFKYDVDKPPSGDKWTSAHVANIAKQYGLVDSVTQKHKNKLFGKDISSETITAAELVEIANKIINNHFDENRLVLTRFAQKEDISLKPVLKDGGGVKRRADYAGIMLEMVIRLVAREKMSVLARKIVETHQFGDLEKFSRELLIEGSMNPLTRKDELQNKIIEYVQSYMNNGNLKGRGTGSSVQPIDQIAARIAEEAIVNYGILPKSGLGEIVEYISPDGKKYLISQELVDLMNIQIDNLAAVGKAVQGRGIHFNEFFERQENTRKIYHTYLMADQMIKDVSGVVGEKLGLDTKEAFELVEDYVLNTTPIEMLKNRNLNEKIKKAGIENIALETDPVKKQTVLNNLEVQKELDNFKRERLNTIVKEKKLNKKQIDELEAILDDAKIVEALHMEKTNDLHKTTYAKISTLHENMNPLQIYSAMIDFPGLGGKEAVKGGLVGVMNFKKQAVTTGFIVPTFAYYFNNAVGGLLQLLLDGGYTGPSKLGQAIGGNLGIYVDTLKYLHNGQIIGMSLTKKSPITNRNSILVTADGKFYTAQTLAIEANKQGIGASFVGAELSRGLLEDLRQQRKFEKAPVRQFLLNTSNTSLEVAQTLDNMFRVATFISELEKGKSPKLAAKITRDTYYDYADLSPDEKKYARNFILFYSFLRKNQIQVFRALVENPSRVFGQIRMIQNSQQEKLEERNLNSLPNWTRMRYFLYGEDAVYSSRAIERIYEDEYGQYITFAPQFGVADASLYMAMIQEIATLDLVGFFEAAGETAQSLLAGTHPVIKFGIEAGIKGETLFMQQDLMNIRVDPKVVQFLNHLPSFTAPFKTADNPDGHIHLVMRLPDDENLTRENYFYYPATPNDAILLLLFNDTLSAIPGGGILVGRQKKFYFDYMGQAIQGAITGEPISLRQGLTPEQVQRAAFGQTGTLLRTAEQEGSFELSRQKKNMPK